MKKNRLIFITVIVTFVMVVLMPCQSVYSAPEKQASGSETRLSISEKPQGPVLPAKAALNPAGIPKIELLNPVFDLGKIGPDTKNVCLFKFKNTGDTTLHIKKVQTTCSCSVPKLTKLDYAPGETGEVTVVFTSPKLPPKLRDGVITKNLYIISDDPKSPKAIITVKAKIVLDVEVVPSSLKLSLLDPSKGVGPVTITSKDGKPFSIKSIVSHNNTVTADFDPTVKKAKFVLNMKVDAEKLKKQLRGTIRINITHPTTTVVSVNYAALPLFKVTRPRFIIQNAIPGKPVVKDVSIVSNYGQAFQIESITSKNKLLEVIERTVEKNSVKLKVQATPPALSGKTRYFTDKLDIKLKNGETLTINCSGWYKRELLSK